jgi:hypothetical protein
MAQRPSGEERALLAEELQRLRLEHRDLDAAIAALERVGAADQLQIQRLKKRKLVLRDRMTFIDDQLTPDIIA